MVAIIPFTGAEPAPIDPDWLTLWSADFPDARLCDAMLADERLGERICGVILERIKVRGDIAARPGGQIGQQLRAYLGLPCHPLLRVLGLLWKAPALASLLPNPEVRQRLGLRNRAQLDIVLAYRDHAAPTAVGPIDNSEAFEADGVRCLYAWISQFEAGLQDRLILSLPFPEGEIDARAARLALSARVLMDDAVPELLAL